VTELFAFWRDHFDELRLLIQQHLTLVVISTAVATAVGVPVGILAARRRSHGGVCLRTSLRTSPAADGHLPAPSVSAGQSSAGRVGSYEGGQDDIQPDIPRCVGQRQWVGLTVTYPDTPAMHVSRETIDSQPVYPEPGRAETGPSASTCGTVWAATNFGRIFVSKNANGPAVEVTFTRIDLPSMPNRFVTRITVDPSNPNVAFISYSGFSALTPSTPGHIFRAVYDPARIARRSRHPTLTWVTSR